jgi:copper transport protein
MSSSHHRALRPLALAALVVGVLVASAQAASAHATLLTAEPQAGAVYDTSPDAVLLRFDEPVEIALGGVRVFDGDGERVDSGPPTHPSGRGTEVRAALPDLGDGTYVVTWRVSSTDAHPIEGAFTFQVGPEASVADADGLAARLLAAQGGSTVVGALYAVDRWVIYASLALLVGGVLFVIAVYPDGRRLRRAATIVWAGWVALVAGTLAGIALEGVYAAALPLTEVFDPSVWTDVIDTRYGEVALLRLALLALAFPLVRAALRREVRQPGWWAPSAVAIGVALAATPGLGGHASSGDHVGIALASSTLHVLAMSCWLGGLTMLGAIVLVRPLPRGLQRAVTRFSSLALGAVTVLVLTGAFQAWRQVGSLDALRDSDFGRLLLAKLVVFAALVVAAAFSREVVNRQFLTPRAGATDEDARVPILASGGSSFGHGAGSSFGHGAGSSFGHGAGSSFGHEGEGHGAAPPGVPANDVVLAHDADLREARQLKRSVLVEVVLAVVVLAITAVLVNTAPARTTSSDPVSLTMRSGPVFADASVAPGVAGRNDIHLTVLSSRGAAVEEAQMQLTRPGDDIAPLEVPLRTLGPGHYYSPRYEIPFPGDWRMVVRVRTGPTDETVLSETFDVR